MKLHYRAAVWLCLGILLAGGITACQSENTPAAQTTGIPETTEAPQTVADICLFDGPSSKYQIVRAETASEEAVSASTFGWRSFQNTYKTTINIGTDWVRKEADIPADTLEILVGETNRAETAAVKAETADGSYRVAVVGQRVVVYASHDWMLEQAMQALLDAVEVDAAGRGYIPGDLNLTCDLSAFARPGWELSGLPSYDGGRLADETFVESLGCKKSNVKSQVICVANTKRQDFDEYLQKTAANGFTNTCVTDANGITAYRIENTELSAYAYYAEAAGEVRIALEKSDTVQLDAFNYTYDKQTGDTTTLYQFGLMMDADGIDFQYNGNTRLNCGHMYFMKLADNSLFIIDGGGIQQMSDATATELLRLFREITGVPEGQKMTISCWFISHRHPDHYNGFTRFLTKYHDQFEMERVLYNIQETNSDLNRIRGLLSSYYKDIIYHKPRTGETITLADISMDVIYTLEDQLSARTGQINSTDFNDTSTVLKITFDGTNFMLLGDASGGAEKVLVKNYKSTYLQADILQVAHHGWNNLGSLYDAVNPIISLYPQSSGGAERGLSGNASAVLSRVRKVSEELYFAGDETVGVSIVGGKPTVTYRHAVVGTNYSGWSW